MRIPLRQGLGLESRARCAGFSVTEIGNRNECLHDYASFPGFPPLFPLTPSPLETSKDTLHPGTGGYDSD